jgi:hypothetical protein
VGLTCESGPLGHRWTRLESPLLTGVDRPYWCASGAVADCSRNCADAVTLTASSGWHVRMKIIFFASASAGRRAGHGIALHGDQSVSSRR